MPFTDSIEFVEIIRADKYTLTATPSDVVAGELYVGSTRQVETGNLPLLEEHSDVTLLSGEQSSTMINSTSCNVCSINERIQRSINDSTL